jgi:hypothetical protein
MMMDDHHQSEKLVLPKRIELLTSPLPRECSTTELRQHRQGRAYGEKHWTGQGNVATDIAMSNKAERDKRLAEALRANLRKRKAAASPLAAPPVADDCKSDPHG